jgi:iron-sulfur cluster repair protein YtfE (RIC family)
MTVRLPDASIQRILFEHKVLRALLSRLGNAAERCSQGKLAAQDLRDSARTLDAVLEAHARREEQVLAPLFEAHGQTARLGQLRASHQRVIELLRKLRGSELKRSASGSATLVRHLLAALDAEDTELREACLLPPRTEAATAVH